MKLAQDVDNILQLNIFESEWRYCNPFQNAALPNEPIYPNFAIKLVAMATGRSCPDRSSTYKYLSVGKKILKIGPVDL